MSPRYRYIRLGRAVSSLLPVMILAEAAVFPGSAFAIQAHGASEGIFVHLGGHVLFGLAMAGLGYRIHATRLHEIRAWRQMACGAWLLTAWNIWAIAGHIVSLYIPASHFIRLGGNMAPDFLVVSWLDVAYYVLRMDHILCVPALFCFYLGLKDLLKIFPGTGIVNHDHHTYPQG